ncbi:helix-turn-helix domain-containing protein [Vibrio genomosp. F10]|uniref:XRE family transcriptional regulator n=2 Tax=Vibrio genomosp. F10 TaxID=723171 RepID=A0A1B9QWD2_9VIBR|nr:XRE family transcriptional regulator [Vibrio genomosp. F10]OCH73913.1 XRE family transcriptional regulator [Vibrio genomosp. F10]OEE32691.1 XRE family transcriptional regulator [Vibrio genomosp. F10 str. ZF-129]OEE94379.1 XRE family transcriptional regulator [Vibrio genomosp. F10 str. 9ZC157]OEF05741.1 XRE family transcriptional regulator [Vibrio genomosp. F10 str. 9ZD137]
MQTEIKVSDNLKRLRKEKGWSLDKAAKATGVSKAMLGQIERGESSPTVAKLWQIASGFDVSFSNFISVSHENELTSLFRDSNELRREDYNPGFLVSLLFPFEQALGFEVFELTLATGYQHESEAHNSGVTEHIMCISGEMSVLFDGNWHRLKPGQAVRFNANQPHGYKNIGEQSVVFHNIIHYANSKQ